MLRHLFLLPNYEVKRKNLLVHKVGENASRNSLAPRLNNEICDIYRTGLSGDCL